MRRVDKGHGGHPVLVDVELRVVLRESVALLGPSGAGKSTLLLTAAGVLAADRGDVTVYGQLLSSIHPEKRAELRRRHIGMVLQHGELIRELSLRENVVLAAQLVGVAHRECGRRADELLEAVGLADRARRRPGRVSDEEVQRAAIARALVHRPAVVLADEPTGALGDDDTAAVLRLLIDLTRARGAGLLIATHDPAVAEACDRVVRLAGGRLHASEGK